MKMFQRIIVFGLAVSLPLAANADSFNVLPIVFPITASRISSVFGMRKHPILRHVRHHSGVDLAAPKNSLVRSILEGQVVYAGTLGGFGKLVTVKHGNGYTSMYGHLTDYTVEVGQNITAGQVVGHVGSTGLATGPHLHFEWRKDGKALNPLKVFPELVARAEG